MLSQPVPCKFCCKNRTTNKKNFLDDAGITFDAWYVQRKTESPQFLYWCTCLELEILVFTFVRALRTGDFDLYVESMTKLTPWFFSLNHTNYARWMPIQVRDMCSLEVSHPQVAYEFRNGKFVMSKSQMPFSLISIDQGHEQNNATMKNDGGIIGLTEDPKLCCAGLLLAQRLCELYLNLNHQSWLQSQTHLKADIMSKQ